ERVTTLIGEISDLELVGEGSNGLEALDLIAKLEPELLFIGVEMTELSGFGFVAAMQDGSVPAVGFITAYEHYALQAFEIGAVDYLHKPGTKRRVAACVGRARERVVLRTEAQRRALVSSAMQAERARGMRARFVVRRN